MGSENRTSLDFKWSKIGWVANGQPFEIRTNGCHFIQNHLKFGQKCPDFEWSSFQMVGIIAMTIANTQPFENQTI